MRIEPLSWPWFVASALALCLLTGCPGKLSDKQEFLDYAPAHPNSGCDTAAAGSGGGGGAASPSAGSSASSGAGGTNGSPCGDVVARIFVPTCGGKGCHSAAAPQQGLDLVSPDVASRVVGVPAKVCGSFLADPQNPQASLMYQKLLTKPKCGAQMPLARPALSQSDVACVLEWIGAQ